jgi:hypothetical protein
LIAFGVIAEHAGTTTSDRSQHGTTDCNWWKMCQQAIIIKVHTVL